MLPSPIIENETLKKPISALTQIGATLLTTKTVLVADEQTPTLIFRWRDRLVRLTINIRDGLTCFLSDRNPTSAEESNWHSIYSFTVPDFDRFDTDQKIDWMVSVPNGALYADFLENHILRLPATLAAEERKT